MEKEKVRVWLYTRDLDLGIPGPGQVVKHWAVVFDYLNKDGQVECSVIYEVFNDMGLLQAKRRNFRQKILEKEWEGKPGYYKKDMGIFPTAGEEMAKEFCEDFNKKKIEYDIIKNNCQKFVQTFLDYLLEDSISLPWTAETFVETLVETLLQ